MDPWVIFAAGAGCGIALGWTVRVLALPGSISLRELREELGCLDVAVQEAVGRRECQATVTAPILRGLAERLDRIEDKVTRPSWMR